MSINHSKSQIALAGALVWLAAFLMSLTTWSSRLDHYDQALFRVGSKILRNGGLLYRDHWDVKQPGIYWFYQLAEQWFGSAAIHGGVHVMSSVWIASTTTILTAAVYLVRPRSRIWMVVPLLTGLTVSLRINVYSIAQVETLIALPMAAVVLCLLLTATRRDENHTLQYLLAGLFAGAVGVFKLILAPIPVLMIVCTATFFPPNRSDKRWLWHNSLGALGFLIVAGLASAPYLAAGQIEYFLWSQFVYPTIAVSLNPLQPIEHLLESITHGVSYIALFLPAAIYAAIGLWRSPDKTARLLFSLLCTWLVIGVAVILVQRLSWHGYHMLLLIWPVGVLAAIGLSASLTPFWTSPAPRRAFAILVFAGVALNGARYCSNDFEHRVVAVHSDQYLAQRPTLRKKIAESSCPQHALIFGNPALFHATGLLPSSSITGQLAPMLIPNQWQQLQADTRARPPMFVYFGDPLHTTLRRQQPSLDDWIIENYSLLVTDHLDGQWFEHVKSNRATNNASCK